MALAMVATGVSASPLAPTVERDPSLEPARAGFLDADAYSPELASFRLVVDGHPVVHRIFAVTTLPGDAVRLRLDGSEAGATYHLRYGQGQAWTASSREWEWLAPDEPGVYPIRVEAGDGDFVHLNVLVMHDWSHVSDGSLHGYAIGSYRSEPLRGDPAYLPPEGFVEATALDVLVSPHFTLGQFLCKQPGERRFLALSVRLVNKLEALLQAVNEAGIEASSFHVMSGFRTPAYNAAIGNKTVYSRHLWGDAADIYVDVDGDHQMDDLNGDGRSDVEDARVLYGLAEGLERAEAPTVSDGGLGLYRRNAAHGPFVHVDARGHSARW
jgi:hypothetical protein